MPTINLQFNHIADNQNNKEVVFNATIDKFDGVITGKVIFTVDNVNALTLTDIEFTENNLFIIEPDGGTPPDAQITMTVPRIKRGPFVVRNNTLQEIKVKMSGQILVDRIVEAGETAHYTSDGASVFTPQGAVSVIGSQGSAGWSRIQFLEVLPAEFDDSFDASFAIGENKEDLIFLLPANSIGVKIIGWIKPFDDNVDLELNFSLDGGVTFEEILGTYQTAIQPALDTGADGSVSGSHIDSKIILAAGVGKGTNKKCSLDTTILNPRNSSEFTEVTSRSTWIDAAGIFNRGRGGGIYEIANIANFARLKFSGGLIGAAKIMIIALPNNV